MLWNHIFLLNINGMYLAFLHYWGIVLGLIGFSGVSKDNHDSFLHPLINTLGLFVFEWTDYNDFNHPLVLDIATISAMITTSFGLFTILFSQYFNKWYIKFIQKRPYNLIIGLSEQNISLLENSYSSKPTIIIEKNKDHPFVDYFKERGFGVKTLDANKVIGLLDLTFVERVVISTSNDRKNIALGKQILTQMKQNKKQSIYVSIGNRDLSVLFKQNVISNDSNRSINVFAFSLYENMAKKLFLEHGILGYQRDIINSKEPFSMIVVGDSDLALEIVYHISFLSTLPNENLLTLYLLESNAKKFREKVKKTFPNIELIPHLNIEAIDVDCETLNFYKNSVWKNKKLTNIFIATQDEEKNLEVAINLQDTTYIHDIGHNKFETKVLFALYHNMGLGEEINNNSDAFSNFYTFGNIAETSTREILFDEEFDWIAKLIHHNYRGVEKMDIYEMYRTWLDISPHKRDSNKTQAMHIDIKLLAFSLKRVKSKDSSSQLLSHNRKIFYGKILNYEEIKEYVCSYNASHYPNSFDTKLIDKVARSEHNRWKAFYYLNGWSYKKERNDKAKEHNCLQPLDKFKEFEQKETYRYDLASVYYIPEYLSRAGYKIVEIDTN